jgi:multisubunit Na+/H+ antiporter MnhG subunit
MKNNDSYFFSTYFDHLVNMKKDRGFFVTDNGSMHKFASHVLKVSLNGLSLTVISFTIVFLFHGVGGGLYCGTVLFRLSHLASKTPNMEVLTTLLVILTIIQPFICLHPVIIWSQDSQHNSTFLALIILIWFLPLGIHIVTKAVLNQGIQKCSQQQVNTADSGAESQVLKTNQHNSYVDSSAKNRIRSKIDTGLRKKSNKIGSNIETGSKNPKNQQKNCEKKRTAFLKFVDIGVQLMQLSFFLTSFTIITHHIVNTEFDLENSNLQDFVLPAIISVFVWMVSISYLLLSVILDESRKTSRLVFKDQNLEDARDRLRTSLRRRLTVMDGGRSFKARSLQRQAMFEAAAASRAKKGQTLPAGLDLSASLQGAKISRESTTVVNVKRPNKYTDLSASMKSTRSNLTSAPGAPQSHREDANAGIELLERGSPDFIETTSGNYYNKTE